MSQAPSTSLSPVRAGEVLDYAVRSAIGLSGRVEAVVTRAFWADALNEGCRMSDGTTAATRMFLRLGNSRNAPPSRLPMRKLDAWVRAAAVCRLRLKTGIAKRNQKT